jgi:hypothetical protein
VTTTSTRILKSIGGSAGSLSVIDGFSGAGDGDEGFAGEAGGVWAYATSPARIPVTINALKKVFISAPYSLLPR